MDPLDSLDPADSSYRELQRLRRAGGVLPNVRDPTWTSLLLAYLDAEKRAVWVIGDYLEGEGLPRIKPGQLSQRISRTLGLLPPLLAHELACDFAEHVFTWAREPVHPTLVHAIGTKRRWLAGQTPDDMVKRARLAVQELSGTFGVGTVSRLMLSSPSPGVAQQVASLAAQSLLGLYDARGRRFPHGPETETRWQAEHLRSKLS